MARSRNPRVYIEGDADGVKKATRDAEKELGRLGKTGSAAFTGLKVGALAAGAAIGTTLAAGIRTGWQEMQETQKVTAQTDAVIKNLGKGAGVTTQRVQDLASRFQDLTGYEDDAIQAAENTILTMAKLSGKALPDATRATLDLARRFDMDLGSASKVVGKALADPEKGLAALQRRVGPFDADVKRNIKTLVEHGQTAKAQALILSELDKKVGGSAEAYGNTLPGAIEKLKRRWEDFTETAVTKAIEYWPRVQQVIERVVGWISDNVVPEVRAAVRNITRFWEEHETDIRAVVGSIVRLLTRIVQNIRDVGRIVAAVIRGDWGDAWDAAKAIVKRTVEGIGDILSSLGRVALRAGKAIVTKLGEGVKAAPGKIASGLVQLVQAATDAVVTHAKALGKKIVQAIVDGIKSLPGAVARAVRGLIPDDITPGFDFPGLATGGFIPGTYRGVDDQVALVASGEAVLTPRQQAMVPGGRATLDRIFRATGGVIGGNRFAQGGVVSAAAKRARDNLGEPYGKPSRGESRTGPNSWDCSGYATYVAGVNVGGTTASAYQASSPAKGGEPIVWGFRKSHSGGYRGGYDEHMGVRVGGVWYQTSGGRTAQTGSDGDWQEIRVPRGLERLRDADAGGPGDASDGGPAGAGARRAGVNGGLTVRGFRAGLRADAAKRRAGARRDPTDIQSITARHADDPLQDRRMRAAGAPESQILQARRNELIQDIKDIEDRIGQLERRRKGLVARRLKLRAEGMNTRTRPARRARIRELIGQILDEETQIKDAMATLRSEKRDLVQQAQILGYDIADAVASEEQDAADASTPDAADASTPDTSPAAGTGSDVIGPAALSPADQALVDRGVANEDFLRTVFGPGDLGMGGQNAWSAASPRWVTLRVDRDSLGSAVGASIDGQGGVPATVVPSGA